MHTHPIKRIIDDLGSISKFIRKINHEVANKNVQAISTRDGFIKAYTCENPKTELQCICNGLIIDVLRNEILCLGQVKYFTWQEYRDRTTPYNINQDVYNNHHWNISPLVHGELVSIFWNRYNSRWEKFTRSTFDKYVDAHEIGTSFIATEFDGNIIMLSVQCITKLTECVLITDLNRAGVAKSVDEAIKKIENTSPIDVKGLVITLSNGQRIKVMHPSIKPIEIDVKELWMKIANFSREDQLKAYTLSNICLAHEQYAYKNAIRDILDVADEIMLQYISTDGKYETVRDAIEANDNTDEGKFQLALAKYSDIFNIESKNYNFYVDYVYSCLSSTLKKY